MEDDRRLEADWEREADNWIRFAGSPEADAFAWHFNLPAFLEIVPAPGRLTLDIGCGDGRVARELARLEHQVMGIDASPTLVRAAREGDPPIDAIEADAADVPLPDGHADLAIAFMSLQSVEDPDGAIAEAGRLLSPGGRLCIAIVHPINSLLGEDECAEGSYFEERRISETLERGGTTVTLHDVHRPLELYFRALENAGLCVELLREPVPGDELVRRRRRAERGRRLPYFLHLRAVRP